MTKSATMTYNARCGTARKTKAILEEEGFDVKTIAYLDGDDLWGGNWLAAAAISPPPGEKAHLFRHTYAVAQIDHGTSIAELQTLMGHKNIATTSIYLRVAAEGLHHTSRATAVNQLIQSTLAGSMRRTV